VFSALSDGLPLGDVADQAPPFSAMATIDGVVR
jgi:hypothetical protein